MYAIRSYYAFRRRVTRRPWYVMRRRPVKWRSIVRASSATSRITSYNVCYTKLLRIAPSVFRELGADVVTLGCSPDGLNINAGVGSTAPDALVAKVLAEGVDLGVAFDGDGDRLIMVDHTSYNFV